MAKEIRRKEPADIHIHKALYRAIIDHKIPPGTALLEDKLSAAFKVSRTVVRKALHKLAHERLVDVVPNKGASVARPSATEAHQIFEARRELEQIIVRMTITKATGVELQSLVKLAKSEQQAFAKGRKADRLQLSGDFHRQLARLSGNAVLESFLEELVSRSSLIIALYESPGAIPCSHTEHLEIANAMLARDAGMAAKYMEHHLQHIEAQIDLTASQQSPDFHQLFAGKSARKKVRG